MMRINKVVACSLVALASYLPNANAETVTLHTPAGFQVMAISPNGKWACGVFIDATMETYGFRWNLQGGSIEMLDPSPNMAWDIANDGTISGDFKDTKALDNGAPIGMPGFWRNGSWHHLQMPEGTLVDGMGGGISPDGQFMTGTICIDNIYTPFIWKNGELHRSLNTGHQAVSYAVSPDGEGAAGFSTQDNRTASYWTPDGGLMFFEDTKYSQSPWNYSRNFSPDGTKLVYWGGWEVEDEAAELIYLYCLYDITTGERIKVKAPALNSDLEFYDVTNSGMLLGADRGRGYIHVGDEGMYIDDYLSKRGVDLSGFDDFYEGTDFYVGQMPITRVVSASEDENILALLYYNRIGEQSSLIIKMDQDLSAVAPAEVKAAQVDGLSVVSLNWKRPVGANSIRGYNVYRDGRKLNGMLPINVPYYYDRNVTPGTYEYEVAAVNNSGTETRSEVVTVTVASEQKQQPLSLLARQKGINSVYALWDKPMTNRVHKRYFDVEARNLESLSIYEQLEVEMAIGYSKGEMSLYSDYQIAEVSFYPMGEHSDWAINIYTVDADGRLVELVSQPITQPLKYRELNTIELDTPVDVPAGDLIVAVHAQVNPEIPGVIGAQMGVVNAGYSDLLRRMTDESYISTYESSVSSGYTVNCLAWAIDLGLQRSDYSAAGNTVTQYNIYVDDTLDGTAQDTRYEVNNLADGMHTIGVEAVYADGTKSPVATSSVNIAANYRAIDKLNLDLGGPGSTSVAIGWEAPMDNDRADITYSTDEKANSGIMGLSENSYALMAAAQYPATMVRPYDGYKLNSFRFYPLADAIFTFMLYENDVMVYELEAEDFKIGQWNDVKVPDEVIINGNSEYRLVLDIFDPEPETRVLAIDDDYPRPNVSDIYSADNGETWSSLTIEAGSNGNWMIGMTVETPEAKPVDINGYDVFVDGKVRTETPIQDTHYVYDFGKNDDMLHTIRVDVYYAALPAVTKGKITTFRLTLGGIADNVISEIKLQKNDNYLTAEGDDIQAISIYDTVGVQVAMAKGDTVNISSLTPGVYIVHINASNQELTRKINIIK